MHLIREDGNGAAGAGRERFGAPARPAGDRRVRRAAVAVVIVLALLGAVAGSWSWANRDLGDAGAELVDLDTEGMTRAEIQAALDEIVTENMMTVSVAPNPVLDADGTVHVNVLNDVSNAFDQRFALVQEQDGVEVVLYESGLLEPGELVESCTAEGAVAGEACIEIQAVVDGEDHGNPVRVAVTLVQAAA